MKRFIIALVLMLLICVPARAVDTEAQTVIKGFHSHKLTESISLFNNGNIFMNSGGYMAFLGYHGVNIQLNESNTLFTLVGEKIDSKSAHLMGALWHSYSSELISSFEDIELWLPVAGTAETRIYGFAMITTPLFGGKLGIATEHNIRPATGNWDELAVGPIYDMGKTMLWAGYDFSPSKSDSDTIFVRTMVKL